MSRLRGFLAVFVTVAVLVAAGVAGARGVLLTSSVVDDAMQEVVEEPEPCPAEEGDPEQGDPEEGDPEQGDPEEGDPEECELEEGPQPEDEGKGEEDVVIAQEDRDAACEVAAGVQESPLPEDERLTGLDNAVSRVLENCKKNPQAPGLLNALERLSENRARKAARDEARAEAKAEREARRAERKAAKQGGGPGGGGPPPHAGPPGGGGPPGHAKGGKG